MITITGMKDRISTHRAARQGARDAARREGLCRSGRARRHRRDLRDQGRPAQRRAGGGQGLERSRLSASGCSTDATDGHRRARLSRAGRASTWWRVENTPDAHNLVVCTLCSCYPWPVLGLPPVWYKSAPYRSRAVIDPRGVLAEFGVTLPRDDRDPRLGFDRRDPLPRAADAARRHRGLERGAARRLSSPAIR